MSDFHLLLRPDPFLFNSEKERAFVMLTEEIASTDSHLVFNGDIFDLTGLTPCEVGLERFFHEAIPRPRQDEKLIQATCRIRSTEELLVGIAAGFPDFFRALSKLAHQGKLTIIPGNHDCALKSSAMQTRFAELMNVNSNTIRWMNELQWEDTLIVAHGNEFDPDNRTDQDCNNPGRILTSALYQGVMPALEMLGLSQETVSAVLAVRPEEETIVGLEHFLGKVEMKRLLLALIRLLAVNGYFHGFSHFAGWVLNRNIPLLTASIRATITTARVRALLPNDELIMIETRAGANRLKSARVLQNPALRNSLVVLGHTHKLDLQPNYVNLGTWIDHVEKYSPVAIASPDRTLPLLVVDSPQKMAVYDARSFLDGKNLKDGRVLWIRPN